MKDNRTHLNGMQALDELSLEQVSGGRLFSAPSAASCKTASVQSAAVQSAAVQLPGGILLAKITPPGIFWK